VTGNLGVAPGTAITGFPPGIVIGAIDDDNSAAITAQADLTTAYNNAATPSRPGSPPITANGDLGGLILPPGLYVASSSMLVNIGETLTLNGPANAVWIFQVGSSLTINGNVVLTGGALASNVFWVVGTGGSGSATIGTGAQMVGTIMAQASVTFAGSGVLAGRALAMAAVNFNGPGSSVVQPGAPFTGPPPPPALSVACPAPGANVGVLYTSAAVATGGTSPYTYLITSGALPPGLTLTPTTGAITGTPTTAGVNPFHVTATDATLTMATASCTITVVAAPLVTCPSSTATIGTAYNSSIGATGGTPPFTSFSISSGTLPAGLSLNTGTGAITGTPTTAGPDPFNVSATDSAGHSGSASCNIATAAAVAVICPTSAAGVGTPYNSSLTATGGTPPYTFAITSGTLPAGLTLNASTGAITGTPTVVGPDVFTAGATDASARNASQSCSLTIGTFPPTPIPSSLNLVLIGLACTVLYRSRERLMRLLRRS